MLDPLNDRFHFFFGRNYVLAKSKIINDRRGFPAQVTILINTSHYLLCYLMLFFIQLKHAQLIEHSLIKTGLCFKRKLFFIVLLRIIIVPKLVIRNIIISISHVFTYIHIIVVILAAVLLVIFSLGVLAKFVFELLGRVLVLFFVQFKGRVFFQLLFYTFFEIGSRHLQQFHQLNLLRRQFL